MLRDPWLCRNITVIPTCVSSRRPIPHFARPVAMSEYKFYSDMSFVEPSCASFPRSVAMSEYNFYSDMYFVQLSCSSFPRPTSLSECKRDSDICVVDPSCFSCPTTEKIRNDARDDLQEAPNRPPRHLESDLQDTSKKPPRTTPKKISKSTTLCTNTCHMCSRTEPNSQTFLSMEREGRLRLGLCRNAA